MQSSIKVGYMAKVLILLPVYNDENRVLRALDSVINQTYPEWKLVVLDNNSSDNTYKKIAGMKKDSRIVVRQNIDTVSAADNWLMAYEIGKKNDEFKYICFLASDDYWHDVNYLEFLVNKAEKSNANFISPLFFSFSDKCEIIENRKIHFSNYNSGFLRVLNLLRDWSIVSIIYGLYTKDLFEDLINNKFSRWNSYLGSDWWWAYAVLKKTKILVEENAIYFKCIDIRHSYEQSRFEFAVDLIAFPIKHFFSQYRRFGIKNIVDLFIILIWSNIHTLKELSKIIIHKIKGRKPLNIRRL